MLPILFMVISGVCGGLSNLCMRRSMDKQGSVTTFFIFQLAMTALVAFFMFPVRNACYHGSWPIFAISIGTGVALGSMKWVLGKALSRGPPGITFAIVNCATLFPAIVFSVLCSFSYTSWHAIGSILIGAGLFWAGWDTKPGQKSRQWIFWVSLAFICHFFYLALTEYRALLMQGTHIGESFVFFFREGLDCQWFSTWTFVIASLFQLGFYLNKKGMTAPRKREVQWGLVGGFANGLCGFFFTIATEQASGETIAFLFPTFAISLMVTCHSWAQYVYLERVHWTANTLCFFGLLLGSAGGKMLNLYEERFWIAQNEQVSPTAPAPMPVSSPSDEPEPPLPA